MSNKSKTFRAVALAAIAAATGFATVTTVPLAAHGHKAASQEQTPNIVETAQSTGVHNTLVAAVTAAGLAGTLSNPGPFTVFAPTDTAFAKLPDGTVATLLRPENKGTLTNVLVYHAVSGSVTSDDLVRLINKHGGEATIETLAGQKLTARLSGDTIVITDAKGRATAVTTANVETANGIIHVTDGVFLPA
ncbi:fasciclin domain-containing protein [Erythrobacter sp. SCSIO 43205]|uniref:fasciclin domain-containing protein n=1 Tax=Erythrobacter sp. SCSIO 43205 TaxID=2779361 RepID=UPI001CA7DE73|nr:fasciclin domain-containing protein [Erythrobacter sp. SCSIO 43205]UAB79053.1 fasciclin domain-containing protein [Erythrobacter sp. SCSIO 43205]